MNTRLATAIGVLLLGLTVAGSAVLTDELPAADEILDRMEANTAAIEDLDATITIRTYRDGEVSLTQTMRLSLLQPDKMRQEYVEPDYLAGNLTIIVGDAMWMYIAVVDQWIEKDLSELSPAEQPWLLFRNMLRDVRSDLDDYAFASVEDTESDAYHIQGSPANDEAIYGRIDLWVDAETFVPVRRMLYDVDGELLVDAHILDVARVDDVANLPLRIEAYDAEGILQNVIVYEEVTLNQGIDEALFHRPEGRNG